jgi:tripartite-type tricarboxylate transporter receptor subunit TctC
MGGENNDTALADDAIGPAVRERRRACAVAADRLPLGRRGRCARPDRRRQRIDIVARAVTQQLAKQLGRPFVVEPSRRSDHDRAAAVTSAAPDGYTILFHSVALTVTPATMANLPYDVARDLAGVIPITNTPLLLVSPPGRFKSVADLVAMAMADKGAMNYATPGYGAAAHFTTERFRLSAGFDAQQIRSAAPSGFGEVVAGRGLLFTPLTTVNR